MFRSHTEGLLMFLVPHRSPQEQQEPSLLAGAHKQYSQVTHNWKLITQ